MNQQKSHQFKTRYGKWAVVTGASSGIGRAMVTELAARGLPLVLVARGQTELEQMARDLSARYGVDARVIRRRFVNESTIAKTLGSNLNF